MAFYPLPEARAGEDTFNHVHEYVSYLMTHGLWGSNEPLFLNLNGPGGHWAFTGNRGVPLRYGQVCAQVVLYIN